LPTPWFSASQTNSFSWQLATNAGGYQTSSKSAIFNNFSIDTQGAWADMRLGMNLAQALQPKLVFDYAYAPYGGQYMDTLQVLVSTDCGLTFSQLWNRGGDSLATAPPKSDAIFVPDATQWRTDTVDLSAFIGQPNVMLAIRNVGKWGQAIYVDNLNLQDSTPQVSTPAEVAATAVAASVFPNPAAHNGVLNFRVSTPETEYELWLFDARGRVVAIRPVSTLKPLALGSLGLSAGTYFWRLQSAQHILQGKLVLE
jgi:hypothetical protein